MSFGFENPPHGFLMIFKINVMDIKINAKGHPNQERLFEYYKKRLTEKFKKFRFLVTVETEIGREQKGDAKVALKVFPEKGNPIYVKSSNVSEHVAFQDAIRKAERQLERYKEIHYKSSHKNVTR